MWLTGLIRFMFGCRPTIGGKYCLGERKRFRSCNIDVSITALHRHHYRQHTIIKIMTITWFNLFCVCSLHGSLPARVSSAWTVCIHALILCICNMCVPATGMPCRLSGFQRDSVLQLWQRSLPGKILHLEAIQRGWVSEWVSKADCEGVNLFTPWWYLLPMASDIIVNQRLLQLGAQAVGSVSYD